MKTRLKQLYHEYPKSFWLLILGMFIDMMGGFMIIPFFSLYVTTKFGVSMIEVGFMFSFYSIGNVIAGTVGGALADKIGRKPVILFGLVSSGLGNLWMAGIETIEVFYLASALLGILGAIGEPAYQAVVADILPNEKQADGFGIIRVAMNICATIGPVVGGLLVIYSYVFLFLADAITSLLTAVILSIYLPETKPDLKPKLKVKSISAESEEFKVSKESEISDKSKKQSYREIFKGYRAPLKDRVFMLFLLFSSLESLIYLQINSTLAVYLRETFGFSESMFGWMLSMNAFLVVAFQFLFTRKTKRFPPMIVIAIGVLFYAMGFFMYGFVQTILWFFLAMVVITIGEMLMAPFKQAIVAKFAPEDKRGRYMAVFQYHWVAPSIFGVILAGLIIESFGGPWLWFICGIIGLISMTGFFSLHKSVKQRLEK